eukprot:1182342-Prorocentrum_minimum.AAC.2
MRRQRSDAKGGLGSRRFFWRRGRGDARRCGTGGTCVQVAGCVSLVIGARPCFCHLESPKSATFARKFLSSSTLFALHPYPRASRSGVSSRSRAQGETVANRTTFRRPTGYVVGGADWLVLSNHPRPSLT